MKRFRRIMSRVGDVVCVVLMVLTVVLFVRGFWCNDVIMRSSEDGLVACANGGGRIHFSRLSWKGYVPQFPYLNSAWKYEVQEANGLQDYKWWFFFRNGSGDWNVKFPLWFLFLIFAVKPAWSLIAWRWRARRLRTVKRPCVNCGYDLQGNADAATCPECGVAVGAESEEPKAESGAA
jgi:hypothetical protein